MITTVEYQRMTADAMSEAVLQQRVLELAATHGWRAYHTHDSRRSQKGFPDLTLVRAGDGRLVFAELKRQTGKVTPEQREWIADLTAVSAAIWPATNLDGPAAVSAYIWRPTDLLSGLIVAQLRARRLS